MKNTESYYMVIPASVWNSNLTAKAILCYGHITVLANKHGYCYANNKYFEKILQVSTRSVTRYLNELEDLGVISRELVYKDSTKLVEKRKIYLKKGIDMYDNSIDTDDHSPIDTDDHSPIDINDQDNNTRSNNTRSNIIDVPSDSDIDTIKGKIFFKIVENYPANRIGNRQHGLKKFKELDIEECKLAAKNLKRYLNTISEPRFTKSLQNYIEQRCYSEDWLEAEELKNQKQNKPITNGIQNTKTFSGKYRIMKTITVNQEQLTNILKNTDKGITLLGPVGVGKTYVFKNHFTTNIPKMYSANDISAIMLKVVWKVLKKEFTYQLQGRVDLIIDDIGTEDYNGILWFKIRCN